MLAVTLLSRGFLSEYEVGFANGLAHNGIAVFVVGSDSTLIERAVSGVTILNLRGRQQPTRSAAAKLRNMLRYFCEYLTFLAPRRGHPLHVIGLFSTRSTTMTLLEAWLARCIGRSTALPPC